jgi:hypothetical protein
MPAHRGTGFQPVQNALVVRDSQFSAHLARVGNPCHNALCVGVIPHRITFANGPRKESVGEYTHPT